MNKEFNDVYVNMISKPTTEQVEPSRDDFAGDMINDLSNKFLSFFEDDKFKEACWMVVHDKMLERLEGEDELAKMEQLAALSEKEQMAILLDIAKENMPEIIDTTMSWMND